MKVGVISCGRIILSDLKEGIFRKIYIFLVPLFIGFFYSVLYYHKLIVIGSHLDYGTGASIGDCIAYIFKGIPRFIAGKNTYFEIPIEYLVINCTLAVFIGKYALKDIREIGKYKLILSGSRFSWWLGKFMWNIVTVIMYYLALFAGMIIAAACNINKYSHKTITIKPDVVFWQNIIRFDNPEGADQINVSMVLLFVSIIIMTSIAISLLQMSLEFHFGSIISVILVVAIYVFSAFKLHILLPGNYLMVNRYYFACSGGIQCNYAILIDALILLVAFFDGLFAIKKYDVI